MGADFSRIRDPLPPPSPSRRRYRHIHRLHSYYAHSSAPPRITNTDSSTLANTLANRSPTPVSRHVALARLADRLTSMGKSRRERVIEQLRINEHTLQQVRRYTPSNSFGSSTDADDWTTGKDFMKHDSPRGSMSSDTDDLDLDSDTCSSPKRPRKIVSFAKYAEMRCF